MSTDEPFLSRWSRRKREGAPAPESEAEIPPAPEGGEALAVASTAPQEQEQEPPFDLAQLPSLDSITASTDIRAFLMRGVPAALSREAMRRAWAADPAIRDFIGLSENSWDFTVPGGVPGFGPADPAHALKEVADLVSPSRALAQRPAESGRYRLTFASARRWSNPCGWSPGAWAGTRGCDGDFTSRRKYEPASRDDRRPRCGQAMPRCCTAGSKQ